MVTGTVYKQVAETGGFRVYVDFNTDTGDNLGGESFWFKDGTTNDEALTAIGARAQALDAKQANQTLVGATVTSEKKEAKPK